MKKSIKRIIAVICMLTFLFSCFPASIFAEESNSEPVLRDSIRGGDELVSYYPNGLYTFVGTRYTVNEKTGSMELVIARQGGVKGDSNVNLKIIDVSSKYGTDYTVEAEGFLWNEKIAENPDAKPLLDELKDSDIIIENSDALGLKEKEPTTEEQEKIDQLIKEKSSQENEPQETTEASQNAKEQAKKTAAQNLNSRVSGLRCAAGIQTGKEYTSPNWREMDMSPSEEEVLSNEYQEYYDKTPGMETTIKFKDGEYKKSIFIKPINDDLSESEEQFIMVLSAPTGGAEIGEFYTSWVNIVDDEPIEDAKYEMQKDKISVSSGTAKVTVTVKRTSGLHTVSYVTVGTASMSAKADVDYIPLSKKLLFMPEVEEQTFTVSLLPKESATNKEFSIMINDPEKFVTNGNAETFVTLQKVDPSLGAQENENSAEMIKTLQDFNIINQSSSIEKITNNGYRSSENIYQIKSQDFTERCNSGSDGPSNLNTDSILMNQSAAWSTEGVRAPVKLYGVKSLDFYWYNTGAGYSWYHHNDWWFFGWHCRGECGWKNIKDYNSRVVINGPFEEPWNLLPGSQYNVVQKKGAFNGYTHTQNVSPWMWNCNNIEYWSWNEGIYASANLVGNNVQLYLQPYSLKINNDSNDTGVQARTVTGLDSSGNPIGNGTPINVGSLKIRSVAREGNFNTSITNSVEKTVYRSDVITFEPEFNKYPNGNSYSDDVYFWGYKVKDRQGNWKSFEGNVMNLNSEWFRNNAEAYKDTTSGLFANALLRNSGDNWEIVVRPVFKAKNETYVKLDIDNSKGYIDGFIKNTSSRVFSISRFDTLSLKTVTANNETVYDWYVQNDNSNIKIDSLSDAKTYFNNKNVGSKGNLATTNAFFDNATKVKLDNTNVNPSAKTILTYKPTQKFTSIMPSFIKNAITVQENPTKRTAFEPYNIKIYSGNTNILPSFLNDDDQSTFYKSEKAKYQSYRFEFMLRSTSNSTVPATVTYKLYKDIPDQGNGVFVEQFDLTKGANNIYSFTLNPWLDKYENAYATLVINGIEQPMDFMLNSGQFTTLNDDRYNVINAGNAFTPIIYDNVTRNDVYAINGYTQSNFSVEWLNATGDLNKDGQISTWEDSLFKDYRMIDRTVTVGDTYYLKATYDMPIVYYNFIKIDPNKAKRIIRGNISISDKTFLNQKINTVSPLSGVQINVNGESSITDSKGNFSIESAKFQADRDYSCVYTYQGYKYTGKFRVGQNNVIIDLFKDPDMEMTYLKMYETPSNGGQELKPTSSGIIQIFAQKDRNYDLEFHLSSARLVSTVVQKAQLILHKANGTFEIISTVDKVNGSAGTFKTQINPASMDAGSYLSVVPIDNANVKYPEIVTGLKVIQDPANIPVNVSASADGDSKPPSVSLFGQMISNLTLFNGNANGKKMTQADRQKLNQMLGTSTTSLQEDKGHMSSKALDDDNIIDETDKNLFTISIGVDNDLVKGYEKPETGINKDAPSLAFKVGFILVYEIRDDGKVYFNQLAISAEVGMSTSVTFTYVTPIGIPIYATFSFSLGVGVTIGITAEDNPPLLADLGKGEKISALVSITFKVGVGVELGVGISILKIYLSGTAQIEFTFAAVGDRAASAKITFSAALGIRFFFFSKEWTIISKTWGIGTKESSLMLSSQLHTPISGFEELTRDYNKNRGRWNNSIAMSSLSSVDSLGQSALSENTLLSGAYPYPDAKLINLPDGKILMVFVDDITGRDAKNRTAVCYSIINSDGTFQTPQIVEDDGTLDESPDVLDLGNGKIYISWSDASKVFDEQDSEKDVLTHMDISCTFFDIAAKTLSAVTAVTKTSGRNAVNTSNNSIIIGDYCGDTDPKAAYDTETNRLILYYTKSDYYDGVPGASIPEGSLDESGSTVDNDEQQMVVGDIVNAFSLITYRFYDFDTNTWNDETSYTPAEEAAMPQMIADNIAAGLLPEGYTIDNYKDDWYGQRFLDVNQVFDITENTNNTPASIVYDDVGNVVSATEASSETIQTANLIKVNGNLSPIDPKIVDTDVISYNGLALFAYTSDPDWDLTTDKDQEMYLQIYNFSENSFSHPIRLTINNVKDSQPKFVRSNGITYLYWNNNGSIVYMDISNLVKYGLRKISENYDGKDYSVYIIDKNNKNYDDKKGQEELNPGENVAVGNWGQINTAVEKGINPNPSENNRATEEKAITSFDVITLGEGDLYLVWTEYITTLINKDNPDLASDPENQKREKQIFAARYQPVAAIERSPSNYINDYGEDVFTVEGTDYQYIYTAGIGKYPDKIKVFDQDGNVTETKTIDYSTTADINGFIGGAKAGDPIIKQELVYTNKPGWSKPAQISDESGANYDELGVVASSNGEGFKIACIKYNQELKTIQGNEETKTFKPDILDRDLCLLTYKISDDSKLTVDDLEFSKEAPIPGDVVEIKLTAKNNGLLDVHNPYVEFYQVKDGVTTLIEKVDINLPSTKANDQESDKIMVGGDSITSTLEYVVPENNGSLCIIAKLKHDDGDPVITQKAFDISATPEFSDLCYEFTGIGKVVIDGKITNIGNKSGDFNVKIKADDSISGKMVLATIPVSIETGKDIHFSKEVTLRDSMFLPVTPQDADDIIKEAAPLTIGVGEGDDEIKADIFVVRQATQYDKTVMDQVESFSLQSKSLNLNPSNTTKIGYALKFKQDDMTNEVTVKYISSNPEVAMVSNDGTVYAISNGTADIQAVLMPNTTTSIASNSYKIAEQMLTVAALPSTILKSDTMQVNVISSSSNVPISDVPKETPVVSDNLDITVKDNKLVADVGKDVTDKLIKEALDKIEEAKKSDIGKSIRPVIEIKATDTGDQTVNDVKVNIPKDALSQITDIQNVELKVVTTIGTISLDKKALSQIISSAPEEQISFDISTNKAAETIKGLPEKQQELITNAVGTRPVFDVSITSGDKEISDFKDGKIKASIPYELPQKGEKAAALVAYTIDDKGKLQIVRGHYNSQTKSVDMSISNPAVYAVGYNLVEYGDVPENRWSYNAVTFISARGISQGVGQDKFSPESNMTRGQFITMLCRAYEIQPRSGDNFNDAGNAYYSGYMAAAKQLHLSSGVGNDKFAPEKQISRQEMIALFYNALKVKNELPTGNGKDMKDFKDANKVDSWATEAMNYFISNGLISGTNGSISPRDSGTRDQMAQVLYTLLSR